jgi:tRNA dimethylallyltransferase
MKAIGIIEVLAYLDGECTREAMIENIITHTAQLAKRQQTFNKTQFEEAVSASLSALPQLIAKVF